MATKSIKKAAITGQIVLFLLVLLWVYAAVSKLSDLQRFQSQMNKQVLPDTLKPVLIFLLPIVEIATAVTLIFDRTRLAGLFLSLGLMLAFTLYVGLAVFKVYPRIPCTCGGILSQMGWQLHFAFNIFYLLLTAVGIHIVYRERRSALQSP